MRSVKIPVLPLIAVVAVIIIGSAYAASSYSGPSPSDARKTAVENRADNFNRAAALIPDPHNTNFPKRRALSQMNNHEDKTGPWYVYVDGDNGNTIGYYVAKYPPISSCDFLSSTEDVWTNDKTALKMQSPSYDGIYYGACDPSIWVIFDYSSGAEIKVIGFKGFVADKPLALNVQPIKIKATR